MFMFGSLSKAARIRAKLLRKFYQLQGVRLCAQTSAVEADGVLWRAGKDCAATEGSLQLQRMLRVSQR